MRWSYLIALMLITASAWAQEAAEPASGNLQKWGVYGSYSYLDTWLPGKIGLVASYGEPNKRTYELAYQSASYSFDVIVDDLGKISDTRVHLSTRAHTWENSFNFQYGVYYSSFLVKLSNSYTDLAGVSIDVIDIKRLGVMWGVGNRWSWKKGFSFGVDYFKIYWPLLDMGSDEDYLDQASGSQKNDAQDVIDAVGSLPTFSLLHLEFGYRF